MARIVAKVDGDGDSLATPHFPSQLQRPPLSSQRWRPPRALDVRLRSYLEAGRRRVSFRLGRQKRRATRRRRPHRRAISQELAAGDSAHRHGPRVDGFVGQMVPRMPEAASRLVEEVCGRAGELLRVRGQHGAGRCPRRRHQVRFPVGRGDGGAGVVGGLVAAYRQLRHDRRGRGPHVSRRCFPGEDWGRRIQNGVARRPSSGPLQSSGDGRRRRKSVDFAAARPTGRFPYRGTEESGDRGASRPADRARRGGGRRLQVRRDGGPFPRGPGREYVEKRDSRTEKPGHVVAGTRARLRYQGEAHAVPSVAGPLTRSPKKSELSFGKSL